MISDLEFSQAASIIGCDVEAVKAVQAVETGGRGGFYKYNPNMPKILFEGHIFWQQLKKRGIDPSKYVKGNEDILYQKWTKAFYSKTTDGEYKRLEKAKAINAEAAYASASWGMFQIMGFNYELCGCKSVSEFVERNKKSEGEQLILFCNFIKKSKLDIYLRLLDWAGFAKRYNGPAYAQNKYDIKLEAAYKKYNA